MKTAEELFEEYKTEHSNGLGFFVWKKQFTKALAEDRQQIIKLIDEMINFYCKVPEHLLQGATTPQINQKDIDTRMAKVEALTELRDKLFPKENME